MILASLLSALLIALVSPLPGLAQTDDWDWEAEEGTGLEDWGEGYGSEIVPGAPAADQEGEAEEGQGEAEEEQGEAEEEQGEEGGEGDEEEGFGVEIVPGAPAAEPADETVDEEDGEWTEEDEYYDQFWEQLEEEQTPATPPAEEVAAGQGRVRGIVFDGDLDAPVFDATVSVDGTPSEVHTGATGEFFFDLDPGFWVIRAQALGYRTVAYEVEVLAGQMIDMGTIALELDEQTVATIVVEGRAQRGTEATQMLRRREATTVTDAVSAEEISRTPDSTANDAVRRVVAATVVDGQFLFVRGLGGRYTTVLLNGAAVPSTDPDFPGVQLDLFPAQLVSSLTITKTFSADLPGDFAGGLMQVATRDYPEEFLLSFGASVTADTETTRSHMLRYPGGELDALGFDDGGRQLPGAVPDGLRVEAGRNGLTAGDVERIAESFPNVWDFHRTRALPDISLNGTVGDTVELGGESHLGYLVSLNYGRSADREESVVRNTRLEGEGDAQALVIREELDQERGTDRARIGALGTVTYGPSPDHDLNLVTLFSQTADDTTRRLTGFSDAEGTQIDRWELRWVERTLLFGQILGAHRHLPADSELHWQLSGALAQRDEPDTRTVLYQEGPQGFVWRPAPGSGERFFADLSQTDWGGGLDWTTPLDDSLSVEVGGMARLSDREFDARRFRFDFVGSDASELLRPAEELFGADAIGPLTQLTEVTVNTDGYVADQSLFAGFGQVDWRLLDPLRLVVGARYERFDQTIEASSPFARTGEPERNERTDDDALVGAGVTWTLAEDEAFLRAGYGGTVARPQLREVAPFLFQDYVRRRTVQGNPELERTYIHNADVRFEYFPDSSEVLAASVFFKQFVAPIEQVILDRNGNVTFDNVDSATNLGAEVEARISLGRIADWLADFTLGANLTVVHSQVSLSEEQRRAATSAERPLAGQSAFVANASLGYEPAETGLSIQLHYNVFGRRIEEVGRLGLPDVYLEPFHSLDLVVLYELGEQWRLKATATNLLMQDEVLTQDDIEVNEAEQGTRFSLGLSWSY